MRLFIIMGLGLTLTVTSACQRDAKRRMSLKRPDQAAAGLSERSKAINQEVGTDNCLRVDKLIHALTSVPSETVLIYTSNLTMLEQGDDEPLLEVLPAGELLKSSRKSGLFGLTYTDDKCATVALTNAGSKPLIYKVMKTTGKDVLALQSADSLEKIVYQFDRRDTLKITVSRSGGAACGKGARELRNTYVLTYAEGMSSIEVSRSMLALLDRAAALPSDIRRAMMNNTNARVHTKVQVSYPAYLMMQKALNESGFKRPLCPTDG